MSEVNLEWHETEQEFIDKHSDQVIKELIKLDLEKASDLIIHHVFLTDDMGGPHVFVWGKDGSNAYQCEYHPFTVWAEVLDEGE